eukprot:366328-Chlamydomonas_euryale.AAC.11
MHSGHLAPSAAAAAAAAADPNGPTSSEVHAAIQLLTRAGVDTLCYAVAPHPCHPHAASSRLGVLTNFLVTTFHADVLCQPVLRTVTKPTESVLRASAPRQSRTPCLP